MTVTQKILNEVNLLLPVLSENISSLTYDDLSELINSDNTYIFVAEDNGKIVGMLTLIIYKIPTGPKAWIEDVVVDKSTQGKGIGKLLVEHAISYARTIDIKKINLTSSPFRVAANILYQKLGFIKRETNVYRLDL
ncbi:MAG: GNAT family N-acetyltransferase [Tannerella sp.]|jgi:ribosomal protein S18 acetylase RimI-like enzyme|nr:GNAT family N-acetyltransferase [Tannerella sp.]